MPQKGASCDGQKVLAVRDRMARTGEPRPPREGVGEGRAGVLPEVRDEDALPEEGEAMSEKPVVYVSGPVTGRENRNREAFEDARRRLCAAGYWVRLPHGCVPPGTEWKEAMRLSIAAMMGCDGVARLTDWRESPGARIEVRLALDLGMPVYDVDEWCRRGEA